MLRLEHGQSLNDSALRSILWYCGTIYGRYLTALCLRRRHCQFPQLGRMTEKAATRFLSASVPSSFYQSYTDFVALRRFISFSLPFKLFGRLLLYPTSMRYAPDYRKHLWCDFNLHLVKTIQVLSSDVRRYLYPIETDPQILGSNLSSLLQGRLQDVMRWIALHVAANIWSDIPGKRGSSE
jgi:RNA polymerase II-associated protein 1